MAGLFASETQTDWTKDTSRPNPNRQAAGRRFYLRLALRDGASAARMGV